MWESVHVVTVGICSYCWHKFRTLKVFCAVTLNSLHHTSVDVVGLLLNEVPGFLTLLMVDYCYCSMKISVVI